MRELKNQPSSHPFIRQKKEITNLDDVRLLVDTFYHKASNDELLAPIFLKNNSQATNLDPLYRYWQTVLLEEQTYDGVPFPKHADFPLTHQHFDRWLSIFHQTVDELFTGHLSEVAKLRAIKMSEVFRYKMELINF